MHSSQTQGAIFNWENLQVVSEIIMRRRSPTSPLCVQFIGYVHGRKKWGNSRMLVYCTPCEEVSGPLWLWWSTAQVCARPSRKSKNMLQRFDLRHLPGHLVAEGRHKECWCVNSVRSAYSSHTQLINCPCFVLCEPDRLSFEFISFSSASNYMQQCLSLKLTVLQLVKQSFSFHGTISLITTFT